MGGDSPDSYGQSRARDREPDHRTQQQMQTDTDSDQQQCRPPHHTGTTPQRITVSHAATPGLLAVT